MRLLLLAVALPVFAQPVAFEAATVKPSQAADSRRPELRFLPGGRFAAANYPLQVLIAAAYDVSFQSARLTGGPDWIRSERYDVEAVAAKGAVPATASSVEQQAIVRRMLQALLAERFQLVVRRESKELPVYMLAVARNGSKLQAAEVSERQCADGGAACHSFMGGQGRGLHGQAVSMNDLARAIENFSDRLVIDKTGIEGLFRIETEGWTNMRGKPAAPGEKAEDGRDIADVATLFEVLAKLGLKLESARAAVELLVIARVEKP